MNWFYESNGQQRGPVSDPELDQLIAAGQITPATLVWREGLANWQPLHTVRSAANPAAPPETAADAARCDACGQTVSRSEIIQIGERSICAACKPAVLQQIQQSGVVMTLGDARTGPPWEHRDQIGYIKTGWATIKAVLATPTQTFETMKREGGLLAPFLFILIVGSIVAEFGVVFQALLKITGHLPQNPNYAENPVLRDNPLLMMITGSGWPWLAAMAVLEPVFIAVFTFIVAGIYHLSLMLCSGARQPFETTFRAYCYSYGAVRTLGLAAGFVTLLGLPGLIVFGLAMSAWIIVVTSIAMAKTHEITTGKAVLAVLLPWVLCCALTFFGALIVGILFGVAASRAQGIH
jgi:hypothetical protein